ncbi:hypothetical protein LJE12_14045 [Blautia sp. DFI.6.71]|nr:hypothetical protein [Blautia sp. DFI.6.71]
MKRKLLIIGAGGHGQVVSEVTEDCGYTIIVRKLLKEFLI